MIETVEVAKALADETRVRLVVACREGERCVCQLTALVALAPSTVSKHLQILKQAGLLTCRREGRWIWYGLPETRTPLVSDALHMVLQAAQLSDETEEDDRALQKILSVTPEELCRA